MSGERVNPFADTTTAPTFDVKPRTAKPVALDQIDLLSREHNFPSRQPARTPEPPTRKRRTHKTGRNQQLNFKATAATIDRFYGMADKRNVLLCELLEQALDALEREGGA
jgi:hypothetical protein